MKRVMHNAPHHDGDPLLPHLRLGLEVAIPSEVRYIESIVELVTLLCGQVGYDPRQIALNVPVALSEALSNAILRGNRDNPDALVQVTADVDADRLVIDVTDEGPGFDFEQCMRDPTTVANLTCEEGRGLYLMRRLMDSVERFTDEGNVVRLTLLRHG